MNRIHRRIVGLAGLVGIGLTCVPATAWSADRPQRYEADPETLISTEVKVVEHLDAPVPRDVTFTNADGRSVQLGDYLDGRRPVILVPVYYRCPMLCGVVMNALAKSLGQMKWTVGQKFQVVMFSFDPNETAELAQKKKRGYLAQYNRPGAADGWHFLVGDQANIKKLTEAIGFGYVWEPKSKQYVHKATALILTPEGHISRYLYDVRFLPRTLRLSLIEAADGKIGSTIDHFVLSCFHYDPQSGTYAAQAMGIVRLGGIGTLVLLGAGVGLWVMVGKHRRKRRAAAP